MKKALPVITVAVAIIVVVFIRAGIVNKGERDARRIILIIPRGGTPAFWAAAAIGAEQACQGTDFKIRWMSQRGDDGQQDVAAYDSVVQGVSGAILAGLDGADPEPWLSKLTVGRLPCVIIGSCSTAQKGASCCVGPDEYISGLVAARRMAEALGAKGNIAVLKHMPESGLMAKREDGFVHTIRNDFAGIKIVDASYGLDTIETALVAATRLLREQPGLDGLFACSQTTSLGALRALRESGLAGKVRMVGFGADETLIDGLRVGTVDSLVVYNGCAMGREAVKAVITAIEGGQLVGHVDVKVVVVTKANLGDAAAQQLVPPANR